MVVFHRRINSGDIWLMPVKKACRSLGCKPRTRGPRHHSRLSWLGQKPPDQEGLLLDRHLNVSTWHLWHLPDTFPAGIRRCQAVHRVHTLSGRNKEVLSFAFNASLTSVNLARAFARQQGMALSVGSTKTLLHNAAMVDRFIAMSGKSPNMRLNNTDFKELLFYGVRAAV